MRTTRTIHAILTLAMLTISPWAQALDIVVTASPGLALDTPDRRTLSRIFLKKLTLDNNGLPLIPVNLPPTHPVRTAFSTIVLRESAKVSARYWNKQYFLGVSPPFVLDSQEAVLRFIDDTPGGIGYTLDCLIRDGANIVFRVEVPDALREKLEPFCPHP